MKNNTIETRLAATNFIIIDDDPLNNLICGKIIDNIVTGAGVRAFTDPELGLDYIRTEFTGTGKPETILLLDINMPMMSGWQVVEELKKNYTTDTLPVIVCMLSSSVNPIDREKANDPFICMYVEKPLSLEKLQAIVSCI